MKQTVMFVAAAAVAALLGLQVTTGPAVAHIDAFTVDGGTVPPRGGATPTVRGTLTCDADETAMVSVVASQLVGGYVVVQAYGFTPEFMCDGSTQDWTAELFAFPVALKPGRADVSAHAQTYTIVEECYTNPTFCYPVYEFHDVREVSTRLNLHP
ncbi:MAG: hypothetical protein HY335_07685 [Deinococcus sp.]|nr:hypothetical protein [Deinococcus sp.]